MPGLKDRKIKVAELVQDDGPFVFQEEIVRETSDDESSSTEIEVHRYPVNWCGHYRPFGFTCYCGNKFCRSCLEAGRVWYCEKCGRTIGPCHFEKRNDGVFCHDCRPTIDWNGTLGGLIKAVLWLAGLVLLILLLALVAGK
ncbi:MAG: hypothetical protein KJ621_10865 [Proteobacteria bacterium]|nr:hypothetical protein [Pseudomonadota bacterium]